MPKFLQLMIVAFTALSLFLISGAESALAAVDPDFDPNFIISDEEMLNWNSLSLSEIQRFLEEKNSYLATYRTENSYGTEKTAAEIIYEAAAANYNHSCFRALREENENLTEEDIRKNCPIITTVNPKFLLVLIQKESSLIENSNPSQNHLDWATGYGCPDDGSRDERYRGFGKQVNSAALQFLAYMQYPLRYPFRTGQAYVFQNNRGTIYNQPLMVTPTNRATAALYNYTPHVFNGNYNVWRLYNRYWPKNEQLPPARYPNGSLLQAKGEPGVWLIHDNYKRPFLSWAALSSQYNPSRIISVDKSELDAYPRGNPIKYPNYSLLRSPDGEIYLVVDDKKRRFATQEIFRTFGFHPDEVINVSFQDLSYYRNGQEISSESTHLTGALLQDPRSGGVFYVRDGYKAPLVDSVMLKTKFKGQTIQVATVEELEKYEKIAPVLFSDGELLKSKAVSTVYLIANGQKRPFFSGQIFENLGYNWDNIIEVSPQLLYLYPFGEMISNSKN